MATVSREALRKKAAHYAQRSRAEHTQAAYGSDWRAWKRFCREYKRPVFTRDPEDVLLWLTEMVERREPLSAKTIERRLYGLRHHLGRELGADNAAVDPEVLRVLHGICRVKGTATKAQKAALAREDLTRVLNALDRETAGGKRMAALVLLAFVTGLRGDNLEALRWSDLRFCDEGVLVWVRRSKTDQLGKGRLVPVHRAKDVGVCPVAALEAWKREQPRGAVALFTRIDRWGNVTADGVRARALREAFQGAIDAAGLDSGKYALHSLRAGMATAAWECGLPDTVVMDRGAWKDLKVASGYFRASDVLVGGVDFTERLLDA
jgi:integrase